MVSIPNATSGLFEITEQEGEKAYTYKRLKMGYTCGSGKICKEKEIENAKPSSFEMEYNFRFLELIGKCILYQRR